jgi:RimJ/RimL family protein N-acetyltransferase
LHSAYWGKGFGTESLNTILDFGFKELNLHRIEAGCAVDNIASIKVLEKVGMIREGRKRQVLPLKSGWSDNFEYAIVETDKRILSTTTPIAH